MVPKLGDYGNGFLFHCFCKVVSLRIERATHGEVLPHHDAIFVTKIKKIMILVYIPSPASYHITVGIYH